MPKPIIEDAVAIVPISDMDETVAFYTDVLEFKVNFVSDDKSFGIVTHGEAAIHFVQSNDPKVLEATANNISIYLWVKHVDDLYLALKSKLDGLPDGRVRPPFTQDYGMREFHVKDPDGCLLFFGEDTE